MRSIQILTYLDTAHAHTQFCAQKPNVLHASHASYLRSQATRQACSKPFRSLKLLASCVTQNNNELHAIFQNLITFIHPFSVARHESYAPPMASSIFSYVQARACAESRPTIGMRAAPYFSSPACAS